MIEYLLEVPEFKPQYWQKRKEKKNQLENVTESKRFHLQKQQSKIYPGIFPSKKCNNLYLYLVI
jgi:hypothetical protein